MTDELEEFEFVPDEFLLPIPDEYTSIPTWRYNAGEIIQFNEKTITKEELIFLYYGKYKSISATARHLNTNYVTLRLTLLRQGIKLISPDYVRKNVGKLLSKNREPSGIRSIPSSDYLIISTRDKVSGKIVCEPLHRYIVKEELGINLKQSDIVHHIDLDKSNNDISNLYVMDNCGDECGRHQKLHHELDNICSSLIKLGYIKFIDGEYVLDFNKLSDSSVIEFKYPKYK